MLRKLLCLSALLISLEGAQANFINGDFTLAGDSWIPSGNVVFQNGQVALRDQSTSSQIYQPTELFGDSVFSFDFFGSLSSLVPLGTGPDTGFATLYFVDNLADFDLNTAQFDASIALFDLDHTGLRLSTGTVGSATAPGWSTFSVTVTTPYRYVIPVVELFNDNLQANDSLLLADNFLMLPLIPHITSMHLTNNSTVILVFEHELGHAGSYVAEKRTVLGDTTNWLPVPSAVITTLSPGIYQAEFPLPPDGLLFFRISL